MSVIQELEQIFGVTFSSPFDLILACLLIFFFFAVTFNFIKLLFRLFSGSKY